MLSPITATMELFKSFETSFSTALYKTNQQENYKWFQSAGREGQGVCFSEEFLATKKAPESVPVGLG